MSTTVTYKDNTLTTVNNATKTLKTAGKYMEGDITLADISNEIYQDQDGYLVLEDQGSNESSSGGELSGNMSDPIRFFDYDGTLVASYSSVPSVLPLVPTHDKLKNGTWNHTLAQISTQFNAVGMCDIGANYETKSGCTEIDVELDSSHLEPNLCVAVNGTVTVDWGDGSSPETITGTSYTALKYKRHAYEVAGKYTISIDGPMAFYKSDSTSPSVLSDTGYSSRRVSYTRLVTSIRLGTSGLVGNYAFDRLYKLESISIPYGITSIGNNAFSYCPSLRSVSIPSSIVSIGNNVFAQCYRLDPLVLPHKEISTGTSLMASSVTMSRFVIPYGTVSISASEFGSCYSLWEVDIPDSVTSIGSNAFYSCYSLRSVTVPDGVTSIGANAFTSCYSVYEYHVLPITPPTLGSTAFSNIVSGTKIYVPAESLEAYKSAANWSTYASYMVGE